MRESCGQTSREEKTAFILAQMKEGKKREEIAELLGYKDWRGLDGFLRRGGYVYQDPIYVLAPDASFHFDPSTLQAPPALRKALELLTEGNQDLLDVAVKVGLKSHKELASLMRTHGWQWNAQRKTYVFESESARQLMDDKGEPSNEATIPEDLNLTPYLPFLQYLWERQEILQDLLDGEAIPCGKASSCSSKRGQTTTRIISLSSSLDQVVQDFSKEKGVDQNELYEAALLFYLRTHGYSGRVEDLLQMHAGVKEGFLQWNQNSDGLLI